MYDTDYFIYIKSFNVTKHPLKDIPVIDSRVSQEPRLMRTVTKLFHHFEIHPDHIQGVDSVSIISCYDRTIVPHSQKMKNVGSQRPSCKRDIPYSFRNSFSIRVLFGIT